MTTHTAPAGLAQIAKSVQSPLADAALAASTAAIEAHANLTRLHLAQACLEADLPEGTLVETVDWAEEPNEDGTYDMDLFEAYLPGGHRNGGVEFGDLGGQGAVNAGRADGGTDWDIFKVEDPSVTRLVIEVTKVYAWLAAKGSQHAPA